ncbi:hypothetical protein SLS59_009976 [Nothophoma quercina]|uniref:DUF8035 domain-containing protein n=1 Tax=Nothophoma quercina TaxID=749835 RepID=A0ABR3QJJ9_9PLEO
MPKRLVEKQIIVELGYPFEEEDEFIIIARALEKSDIDECIEASRRFRESQATCSHQPFRAQKNDAKDNLKTTETSDEAEDLDDSLFEAQKRSPRALHEYLRDNQVRHIDQRALDVSSESDRQTAELETMEGSLLSANKRLHSDRVELDDHASSPSDNPDAFKDLEDPTLRKASFRPTFTRRVSDERNRASDDESLPRVREMLNPFRREVINRNRSLRWDEDLGVSPSDQDDYITPAPPLPVVGKIPDRSYHVAPRDPTLPERQKSVEVETGSSGNDLLQRAESSRPRSGEVVDWLDKIEINSSSAYKA